MFVFSFAVSKRDENTIKCRGERPKTTANDGGVAENWARSARVGNKAITANHDRLLKDDEGRRGDKSKSVRVRGAGRAGSNSHELIGQFSKSGQQRERERERDCPGAVLI